MNLSQFIEAAPHIPAPLIRSTVRQLGGWHSFKESAPDVARYGAAVGFGGFIYYSETVAFSRRNKAAIMELVDTQARDFDVASPAVFVAGFNCLQDEDAGEVERALYTGKGEAATAVYNALAWYALEEIARAYDDLRD